MIERLPDRVIITVGDQQTVVARDKLEELLPIYYEKALEEIQRLQLEGMSPDDKIRALIGRPV